MGAGAYAGQQADIPDSLGGQVTGEVVGGLAGGASAIGVGKAASKVGKFGSRFTTGAKDMFGITSDVQFKKRNKPAFEQQARQLL